MLSSLTFNFQLNSFFGFQFFIKHRFGRFFNKKLVITIYRLFWITGWWPKIPYLFFKVETRVQYNSIFFYFKFFKGLRIMRFFFFFYLFIYNQAYVLFNDKLSSLNFYYLS